LVGDSLLAGAAVPLPEEVDGVEPELVVQPGPEEDATARRIVLSVQDDHPFEEMPEELLEIGVGQRLARR
jgi:hypothetical protein